MDNGLSATYVTDLPIRPNVNYLPPRLIRPFRSTNTLKKDAEAFAKKAAQKPITKTVPFKEAYKLTLAVDSETAGAATRKLRDYGVYHHATPRMDNVPEDEVEFASEEDFLIAAAGLHSFDRISQ